MSGPAPAKLSTACGTRQFDMEKKPEWPGVMDDGTHAPPNTDKARLDWFGRNPDKVQNLKGGVRATDIKTQWQPTLRAAIDAAIEYARRDLRAKGLEPQW